MTAVVCAALLCARRRIGLPPLLLALALPAIAYLAGRRAAAPLEAAVATSRPAALSLALGLGSAAALAGLIVALITPRRRFLGSQLAAAPLPPLALFAAVTFVPFAVAGAAASAIEAAFLVPALGRAAPVAVLAGCAGFLLGAAVAEGATGLRSSPLAWGVLAAVGGLWVAAAAGAGAGIVFGPFGYLGLALRGEPVAFGSPGPSLAGLTLAAVGLWAAAAAVRADEPPSRGAVRAFLRVGSPPLAAAVTVALKCYGRRPELRRAGWAAAAAVGLGGLVMAVRLGPAAVPFAGALAVLGGTVVPLAAVGIDREAEWIWRAAPVPRWQTAAVASLGALVLGGSLVLVGTAPAAGWARAPGAVLLQVAGAAVFVLAAALIAGALVPWRSDRPGEELATCVALVGVAAALWFALGHAAGALGGGGAATASLLTLEAGTAVALTGLLAELGARR
jgi:hypothetical protein